MQTIRQQLIAALEEKNLTAREISKELKIREKEVFEHLVHIRQTLKNRKQKLIVTPFQCMVCDFIFKDRKRLTRPGRCPKCKQGHIEAASYSIISFKKKSGKSPFTESLEFNE
jgi:predicted Zn-ribbon and HTH transcriptional regulator